MFRYVKNDMSAGIVVFFVALPLCLGIALASGAPLFAGIIAGIIGGIVVGLFSGSALGVSGPAAGLAVIVFNSIDKLGAWQAFLLAVVLAGIIQFIMGLAKLGGIAYYFPSSVIKGMLTGIGLIIILKQVPHALGYNKATVIGVVFTDLLKGIAIGMIFAVFYILRNNFRNPFYMINDKHETGPLYKIVLSEEVSFLNKGSILQMLNHVPANAWVVIDGKNSRAIDYDVVEIINNFKTRAEMKNIKLEVVGIDKNKLT